MTNPIRKQDLRKVNDYVWEIPATFRAGMTVAVRLFANEDLLEDILKDESLVQAINVASLPGLIQAVCVMPDAHRGYGMPIGGVMASEAPHGIISPGAIGYDVNCLCKGSRILNECGYYNLIETMANERRDVSLTVQDFGLRRPVPAKIIRYLVQRPKRQVLEVATGAGDTIQATADHPFWTPAGMLPLEHLNSGDKIAIHPFQGVAYVDPGDDILIDEPEVRKILEQEGKNDWNGGIERSLTRLRTAGLLPLHRNSEKLPTLLKVAGFIFGDGSMNFLRERHEGILSFTGQPEDMTEIAQDMRLLGLAPTRVQVRTRQHRTISDTKTYEFESTVADFQVGSNGLVALLAALGVPKGTKTTQDFSFPVWLFHAPLWQKRLFLAAYLGAELTTPAQRSGRWRNLNAPHITLNKRIGYTASGIKFLEDLALLLKEFGIKTRAVTQARSHSKNVDGTRSITLRLTISSDSESLIALWTRVGIEYNQTKQQLTAVAAQYQKRKQEVKRLRSQTRAQAVAMYKAGVQPVAIVRALAGEVNQRFVERSIYSAAHEHVYVGRDFLSFDDYQSEATEGIFGSGMVWETIASITPIDYDGYVYDFTVDHPDHNFIANGFVVSNCGVRLLTSEIAYDEAEPHLAELATSLQRHCPSGVGEEGDLRLTTAQLDELCREGARWALRHGYARQEDLDRTEESGRLEGADPRKVSERAKERAKNQVGTLGSGNHFLEVDIVDEIFDDKAAVALGLRQGCLAVQIHCGSRGFGHQVCTDYVQSFQASVKRYGITLPDRELVCAPLDSPEGRAYLAAMHCAANFAFANRQVLAHYARQAFEEVLRGKLPDWDLHQVYDIAHNMAKLETHEVGGRELELCVHRKGATRAFGPGFAGLPEEYRALGQPVLVPGSMGTASWVLLGTATGMAQSFGSTCHGAGRVMSRSQAKREIQGDKLKRELQHRGIHVRAGSLSGLAEEAPQAYKNVDRVVEVVSKAGIARKVARLRPVAVVKG